jgi:hypothetical protein
MPDSPIKSGQAAQFKRHHHVVDLSELVPGLVNHDGLPITKAVVRIHLADELDQALIASEAHITGKATALAPDARARFSANDDAIENARAIEAMWHAFRLADDPDYPLFPSSKWMRENLTVQKVGQLANVYEMCEAAETPSPWPELTPEQVESTRSVVYQHLDSNVPEKLLEPYVLSEHGRRFLVQFISMMAVAWTQERDRCREALKAARTALDDCKEDDVDFPEERELIRDALESLPE